MVQIKVRPKYLAGYLMYRYGLELINKEKDRKNPSHYVYLFENTEELDRAMGEYIEMRKEQMKV